MAKEIILDEVHEKLQSIGLSDPRLTTAAAAVLLGSEKILNIFDATSEYLRIEYKAEAGKTPRTIADLESGSCKTS